MITINEDITNKIEIKKSIFITKLYKVKTIDEVNNYIKEVKKEYKDATHYCYGYRINDNKKSSDDNEPGGTAGVPIMEVLLKNNLNYVLCIVIRYFGGIKLGTGGLVRAYSKAVKDCIKQDNLRVLINGYRIKIITTYDKQRSTDYLLKNCTFNKIYNANVTYICECSNEVIKKLEDNNVNFEVLDKIEIEA